MTKNILQISVLILCFGPLLQAQTEPMELNNLRFGAHASPFVSWMFTSDNRIQSNGLNAGLKIGAVSEYYFAENYAVTSGLSLSFNNGGTLRHEIGGDLLARSELSLEELHSLGDGTDIDYSLQYMEIPIGLKMRTREFGYIRYFVNIPVFTLGALTKARADIMAPNISSNEENVTKDVFFFTLSWGLGSGIEYSLSTETSLVAGIYYQQSFIDVTGDRGQKNNDRRENSKGSFGLLALRLGVLF